MKKILVIVSVIILALFAWIIKVQSELSSMKDEGIRKTRKLPVVVKWRHSALDSSKVAMISRCDGSDKPMRLIIEWKDGSVGLNKSAIIDLKGRTDIGHLEGFRFMKGDELKVWNNDFDPQVFTCD